MKKSLNLKEIPLFREFQISIGFGFLFLLFFASLDCKSIPSGSEPDSIDGEYPEIPFPANWEKPMGIPPITLFQYKVENGQVYLRLNLTEKNRSKDGSGSEEAEHVWALLDSGSFENLYTKMDSESILRVDWGSGAQDENFLPMGKSSDLGPEMILGLPFFRKVCMVWESGFPVEIYPNQRKPCKFPLGKTTETGNPRERFYLKSGDGNLLIPARVGNREFDLVFDTGSGFSAFPLSSLSDLMISNQRKKSVLYPGGQTRIVSEYRLKDPVRIGRNVRFLPKRVFNSEEVWVDSEEFFPVWGREDWRGFRIYIDFGSKILEIESHESIER